MVDSIQHSLCVHSGHRLRSLLRCPIGAPSILSSANKQTPEGECILYQGRTSIPNIFFMCCLGFEMVALQDTNRECLSAYVRWLVYTEMLCFSFKTYFQLLHTLCVVAS